MRAVRRVSDPAALGAGRHGRGTTIHDPIALLAGISHSLPLLSELLEGIESYVQLSTEVEGGSMVQYAAFWGALRSLAVDAIRRVRASDHRDNHTLSSSSSSSSCASSSSSSALQDQWGLY